MMKRMTFAVMALMLAGAASAQDAAPARPPGYQTHDGFYLNLGLGVGGLNSSASTPLGDLEISGTGMVLNVGLGGAVNPNFLVGGRIFSAAVSDPTVKLGGIEGTATDTTSGLVGYGLDLIYYFDPANVYVGVSPAMTRLTATDTNGDSATSDWGFGFRLAAGKEWWVSDNWGLGLNVEYARSSNKDSGEGAPTITTNWFGVAFSATFN